MSVRVSLEIGHEASIRNKITSDGFTHDWEVFVRGCSEADIHYFIEKVVFFLHDTFPNPKRVIKEPPYRVKESGYAGFNLPIEIYLRNSEEPKKIRFNYDLNLQPNGPTIYKMQKENYVFNNPNEAFRHKLLKGGGIVVNPVNDSARESSSSDKQLGSSKSKSSSSADLQKRHKVKEHKQEDSFTDLFGTPITKTSKVSPDGKISSKTSPTVNAAKPDKLSNSKKSKSKHSPKEKDRDKEKKEKPPEKKHKEEKKPKERVKEKERKEKKRSPSPARSPKRPPSPKRAPSPKRPPSPPPKPKIEEKKPDEILKDKAKLDLKKSKHEQKDKEKEKKEHKAHKEKEVSNRIPDIKDAKNVAKEAKIVKEPVPYKNKDKPLKMPEEAIARDVPKVEKLEKPKVEKVEPEKQKHKHKKKENKEKREKKEEKVKEKKSEKKLEKAESFFEKTYREEARESPKELEKSSSKPVEVMVDRSNSKEKTKINTPKADILDDSSNSSLISNDDSSLEVPQKVAEKKKERKNEQSPEKKRKRRHEAALKDEPPAKVDEPPAKLIREENEFGQKPAEAKKDNLEEELTQDYMSILKELQHKIMSLQDNAELQRVVQLIAETGHYEITAKTFDFDLCALDRDTVRRLQEFFAVT